MAGKEVVKPEKHTRGLIWRGTALVALTVSFLAVAISPAIAQDPKPDPAGIATGDRTTAVDG